MDTRKWSDQFPFNAPGQVTSSRDSPFHTVTDRFTCQECGHERTQYRTWRRKAVVDRVSNNTFWWLETSAVLLVA